MHGGKYQKACLCPFSLGVALGLTSALFVFLWLVWMMHYGVPAAMTQYMTTVTWGDVGFYTLCALIKGFLFGLIAALIYGAIICMTSKRCGSYDGNIGTQCKCGPGCQCQRGGSGTGSINTTGV